MSTFPTSDLAEPVGEPTGPTEGLGIAGVVAPLNENADSIVGVPELYVAPPVAESGSVILAVESPWSCDVFNPSLDGCPPITRRGVGVSSSLADQAITIGVANGITIVKR